MGIVNCFGGRFKMLQLAAYQRDGRACLSKCTSHSTRDARSTASYKCDAAAQDSVYKDFVGHSFLQRNPGIARSAIKFRKQMALV